MYEYIQSLTIIINIQSDYLIYFVSISHERCRRRRRATAGNTLHTMLDTDQSVVESVPTEDRPRDGQGATTDEQVVVSSAEGLNLDTASPLDSSPPATTEQPRRSSFSSGRPKKASVTLVEPDSAIGSSRQDKALLEPMEIDTESLEPPDFDSGGGAFLDPRRSSGSGGFASISSCVLNLSNTTLGTSLFALPYNFAMSGIVFGVLIITLSGMLGATSLYMLSLAGARVGRPTTFYLVCEAAMRRLGLLVDVALLVSTLGSATSYLIVATDSFVTVASSIHSSWTAEASGSLPLDQSRPLWIFVTAAIVLPLSFLRHMDALRFSSLIAIVLLLSLSAMVVVFALPTPGIPWLQPCTGACAGAVDLVGAPLGIMRATATFINSYASQMSIFSIMNELERPTTARMATVVGLGTGLALTLYMTVALAGYLTFGNPVQSDILKMYPSTGLITAARLGLAFVVISSYPIQAFAARISITNLLRAGRTYLHSRSRALTDPADSHDAKCGTEFTETAASGDDNLAKHSVSHRLLATCCTKEWPKSRTFVSEPEGALVTLGFISVTIGIALVVSNLGVIIELSGAIGGITIAFIAPGIVYPRIFTEDLGSPLLATSKGLLILGVVLVPLSAVLTFI